MDKFNLFHDLFRIALEAGNAIMDVYAEDFDVELKDDDSPITIADKQANNVIVGGLKKLNPNIPVLSEEGKTIIYSERKEWSRFWLVDPLDGTKEFVNKNGEFTVNIALIEESYPSVGIIYAPVLDIVYFGMVGEGAFKLEKASEKIIKDDEDLFQRSVRLSGIEKRGVNRVVASRSHMSEETEAFIKELEAKHGAVEVVSSGSSLKFCLVAEGKADFYPRYAPTMEWDTGAGQAIVEAVGGKVSRYEDGQRFFYNKEELRNGWFLAESNNLKLGLRVEKDINEISRTAFDIVIEQAGDAIREFNGQPVVGKEQLANFVSILKNKLLTTELSEEQVVAVGSVLIQESTYGELTGGYFPRLEELVYYVDNIDFHKNDLNNPIGIREKG